MRFQNILCVCTGNICRSPLAKGLLQRDAPELSADSAGTGAVVDGRMPKEAVAIAEREGLDLDAHRGKQLTAELAAWADLILVMETEQKDWVVDRFPQMRGRVFLATQWTDGLDVADPYRHDAAFFERAYGHLAKGMRAWVAKVAAA